MLNILSPSKTQASNYPDIITHLLAYLLLLVPSIDMRIEDIAVISRQISLVLVGVIILSSMRLVLRGVTRVSTSNLLLNIFSSATTGSARDQSKSRSFFDASYSRPTDGMSSPALATITHVFN